MKRSLVLSALIALQSSFTAAQSSSDLSPEDLNTDPPEPQIDACGTINHQNLYNQINFFEAELARQCLTSVPFDPAVATRFVAWYNQTLQFHTTPAFLKNPPQSYLQPAADIFADLQNIQDRIDSNYYRNQYVFEADLQRLILGAHDNHLSLFAGALSQFSWGAPFQIVSVSEDGRKEPKVYFWYTIKNYTITGEVPSPIKSINNVPVIEYLERFAAQQSFGMVEPHADWNNLMITPAMKTMGYRSVFSSGGTFYPGNDYLDNTYENGSTYNVPWLAQYSTPYFTGPLATGGDFYNLFVLGNVPANYNESFAHFANYPNDTQQSARRLRARQSDAESDAVSNSTNWHDLATAYPEDTISHQYNLGIETSGYVTGYYLDDISTAVVSIPSFDIFGDDDGTTFEVAIADFIANATQRSASKLIIDLQQNFGGQESLVFEAIRQLFPSISPPPTPSRMRSHPLGDYLGSTITSYFQKREEQKKTQDLTYDILVAEEWAITDRLNFDTKQNFTSWEEFHGPLNYNGDTFSRIEEYNLTSEVFDYDALAYNSTPYSKNGTQSRQNPWDAGNVVILTDGLCSSACSLFVEIATQQLGVRTVVVGGSITKATPMQAASGTRGALIYYSDQLDLDFAGAEAITNVAYPAYNDDTGMDITYASINLRDQIRPVNDGVPNQFLYLPANCRIYWTLANFNDFARLWHDASDAIFKDQSICVGGYQTTTAPKVVRRRTTRPSKRIVSEEISEYINEGLSVSDDVIPFNGFHNGYSADIASRQSNVKYCKTDKDCGTSGKCQQTSITCKFGCARGKPCQTKKETTGVCAPLLNVGGSCSGTFVLAKGTSGKQASQVYNNKRVQGDAPQKGYCIPSDQSAGQPTCNS